MKRGRTTIKTVSTIRILKKLSKEKRIVKMQKHALVKLLGRHDSRTNNYKRNLGIVP